jgi:hypothetical protein
MLASAIDQPNASMGRRRIGEEQSENMEEMDT